MAKLTKDEIVTLQVLSVKGQSKRAIARQLNVSEGSVRYHLRRQAAQATDGRKKQTRIEKLHLVEVVQHWWQDQLDHLPSGRSPNVQQLWQLLAEDYQYDGSYKSVAKYVRTHFPKPKLRPFRRIETPPGAQTQSDWLEAHVNFDGLVTKVYGFVMTLSHSRMAAVIWSLSMNQLAWSHVHNEAFKRLGGVAAVNRIDNLKTGVAHGSGPWGKINESYQAYARTLGFHVDPHEVRQPQQKGKAERRVSAVKQRLDLKRSFVSLEDLQSYTDDQLDSDAQSRKCPVTGKSVQETWQAERKLLRPLPATLPEPFDLIRTCAVHKDSTIRFEGRTYTVPFRYAQAIRISHLPTGLTISNFDFAFQPSVSRSQIQTLATGQWIREGHGLLLQGPPGVGKTHLVVGLGLRAIETGFSVSFYRLDELMHQLKRDAELSPVRLKHRKYMASNLVIIDEFGYMSLS